jgi:inosose dehydratase
VAPIALAAGPVSWGVDFADAPGNAPYAVVLDGIARAGVEWLELGPVGYLPSDPEAVRWELRRRGLSSVGTFVFDDLHDPGAARRVCHAAERALGAIVATEGRLIVLIDRPDAARAATAGRADAAVPLARGAWDAMVDTVRQIAVRAAERGVRAVFHPHAGTYVEFEREVERLLADVPHDELGLCLDTGHALYAGDDPANLIRRYGDRIEHLHLKDVAADVRDRGEDFWSALAHGAFCPIGGGMLDIAAVRDALAAIGYNGFATVEQDRREDTAGTPADDLRRSVAYLRAAGIG